METKWIAIAVAVCSVAFYAAMSVESAKKADVKIACYQAQAKTSVDLRCDK